MVEAAIRTEGLLCLAPAQRLKSDGVVRSVKARRRGRCNDHSTKKDAASLTKLTETTRFLGVLEYLCSLR